MIQPTAKTEKTFPNHKNSDFFLSCILQVAQNNAMHNERVLGDLALSSLLILQFSKEYFTAVETEVFLVM